MVDYPEDQVLHEGTDIRYYVSHTPQNKSVIIKDFSCANMQDVAAHIREGIVQAEIAHPNICKMITMQPEQDGPRFRVKIVFEFIQKRLLQEIEERRGHNPPLHYTEDELRVFLRKIANALRLAHSKNIAHRDINPEHIYITPEGEYKLSDFGSAWRKDDERAYASTLVGQFMFMCPAMKRAAAAAQRNVEGGYNEQKADVYSLGVTLIFMAKLYPPNSLSSMAKYDLNLEKLLGEVIATGISPQFAHIIRNMVRAEESQCYDITNVIEALSQPTPTTVAFALTSRHLHYYSFPEHGWRTVVLSGAALQVNEHSALAPLNTETMFCCGGGSRPCN